MFDEMRNRGLEADNSAHSLEGWDIAGRIESPNCWMMKVLPRLV